MNTVAGLVSTNYNCYSFGSLLENRPIASLPFGGRYRMVDFPLSNMVNSGITTVGLITPYHFRSVLDHVGVGKEWNLARKRGGMFVLPGSVYGFKSTTGKLQLRDLLDNREYIDRAEETDFVIAAASTVINIDLRPIIEQHQEQDADVTMICKRGMSDVRNLGFHLSLAEDGTIIRIADVASGTDALYLDYMIIKHSVLSQLLDWYATAPHLDLVEVIRENLTSFKVQSYEYDGYVGIISNLADYMAVSHDMFKSEAAESLFMNNRSIYTKVQDSTPARYLGGSSSNSVIATGCTIRGTVKDSMLFRNVTVGEGAVLENCIVFQRCVIEAGAHLTNVILDKGVHISKGVTLSGTDENPFVVQKHQTI